MKTYTFVFLIALILGCNIEVDCFHFNLSGGIYPGIIFDRTYGLRENYQLRNNQHDDDSYWPQIERVNHYDVPEFFSKPVNNEITTDDNEGPQTHHHGPHQRIYRH